MKEMLDFIVLIILYICIFYKIWNKKGKDILFVNTLMYIYLSFVLYFTLMPIITSLPFIFNHTYIKMNLEPFIDVLNGRGDFIRQVGLNVIMTIPFGFLITLVRNKKTKLLNVIFCTFLLSLVIELLQPLINGVRSSDITDIITNTIGGIVGYVLYLLFKPIITRMLNYIKKSSKLIIKN